ncbi:MAG TPA: hypothetical protein VHJ20_21815 [Polyangia bacterium]|nr:hypothetical protein [Polyangia bacterium]
MTTFKKRALSLFLGLCTVAIATEAHAGYVWSGPVVISKVDVEADAAATYLTFASTPVSASCSATNGQWVVTGSADTIKSIVSLALAAKLAGAPVKVLFNNSYSGTASCDGSGHTGYPVLRGLEIQ